MPDLVRDGSTSSSTSAADGRCPLGICDGSGLVDLVTDEFPNGAVRPCRHVLEAEHRRRREELLTAARIPPAFAAIDLDVLDKRHPRALAAAQAYVERWPIHGGRGLLFVGDVGTGKTTLAYGVFNRLVDAGVAGVSVNGARLMRDLGRGVRDRRIDEQLDLLCEAPLLLIDDIAAHRTATAFSAECMFQVVNERYANRRPTLYTSMLDLADWGGTEDLKLAQMWKAILSRIVASTDRFLLGGPDRRLETRA